MRVSAPRGVFTAFALATTVALCVLGWPTEAQACSCRRPDVSRSVDSADLVFQGHVASVQGAWKSRKGSASPWPVADFLFQVERVWKGHIGKSVTVSTSPQTASCGYPFVVGDTYVVFAYAEPDTTGAVQGYRTSLCDPNASVSEAAAIIAALEGGGDAKDPKSAAGKQIAKLEPPKVPTRSGTVPVMPPKPAAPAPDPTTPPNPTAAPNPTGAAVEPASAAPDPKLRRVGESASKGGCGACAVGPSSSSLGPFSTWLLFGVFGVGLGAAAVRRRRRRLHGHSDR